MSSNPSAVALSRSTNLDDTEPVAWRGILGSFITLALTVFVLRGYITDEQKTALDAQTAIILTAVTTAIPVLMAIWARMKAVAPRTAAIIAVHNAAVATDAAKAGLLPPPPTVTVP